VDGLKKGKGKERECVSIYEKVKQKSSM